MNSKPFDLEHALKHGCRTRAGRRVKILHVLNNSDVDYPVLGIFTEPEGQEYWNQWQKNGLEFSGRSGDGDLVNIEEGE